MSRLNFISKHYLDIKVSNTVKHCEICHFAKQDRLSFPKNTSKCDYIFDLIHINVRGSFSISTYDGKRYLITLVDVH